MTARHTPQQQFKEAQQIARDHGCFVVQKGDRFLVYRKTPATPVLLGFRRDVSQLRAFVCRVTNFH